MGSKEYFKFSRDIKYGIKVNLTQPSTQLVIHTSKYTKSNDIKNIFNTGNIILNHTTSIYNENIRNFTNERNRLNVDIDLNFISKQSLLDQNHHSENDNKIDEFNSIARIDYSQPQIPHRGANTIIYATPLLGWERTNGP